MKTLKCKKALHAFFLNKKRKIQNISELSFIIFVLLFAGLSFFVLLGLTPLAPNRAICIFLIFVNLSFVCFLSYFILAKLYHIYRAWRAGRGGARLHVQIVSLFSFVATLPALAVAVVSVTTLNLGLDRWFDKTTTQVINSSIDIANVYAEETLQILRDAAHVMTLTLDQQKLLLTDPREYRRRLTLQAAGYKLKGAFLLSGSGTVYISTMLGDEEKIPLPPASLISRATLEQSFLFQPGAHDYFGVISRFRNMPNTYLYIVRDVNQSVLNALRLTERNTNRYKDMQESRVPLQLAFAVLYLSLFFVMLLCAIWTGIHVADRLVSPIRLLIDAADEVASGNMEVVLPIWKGDDTLMQLLKTFNYMVHELKNQRNELIHARDQIDDRRRFSEAVLAGVTAGVIGVDSLGAITIINRSIETMFNVSFEDLIGKDLFVLNRELGNSFEIARSANVNNYRDQITIITSGKERVYNVQITMEESAEEEHSFVVTVDDITNLVEAQRASAWADVARRIAHEIKNPLTPIQLSAERIKRRYGERIVEDKEIFDQCIETIIRQVGDIGHMVNEFFSFSRMPKPVMRLLDLKQVLQEAIFLIEVTRYDISFQHDFGDVPLWGEFDNRLLIQAFNNILKNATESIDSVRKERSEKGCIAIRARREDPYVIVDIMDNGKGFPKHQRQKLLEPYITTRGKGTGLGLAIVKKIIEDHQGSLELLNAPEDFYGGLGAMVRIIFPAYGGGE